MKRTLLSLFILSACTLLTAQQTLDILTISGRYGFPGSYNETYTGEATEYGAFFGLTAPVPLSDKTIIINNLNYFYFHVAGDPAIPSGNVNPINLNGFILRTGLYKKFSKGRGIQILFAPRLMTDFQNMDGSSFQLGGIIMYEKVFRDELTMGFGVTFNQEFFGPYVVPIVNLNWQLSEKWSIAGMLPIYAKVNYSVNENLTVGFSHFGLVTTYLLGDPDYAGDYMERQSIDLSLFARQRLFGNIYVEGRAGRALSRSYEQYAADQKVPFSLPLIGFGDDRVVKNVTFNDGFIIDLRLVFNIPIPE